MVCVSAVKTSWSGRSNTINTNLSPSLANGETFILHRAREETFIINLLLSEINWDAWFVF